MLEPMDNRQDKLNESQLHPFVPKPTLKKIGVTVFTFPTSALPLWVTV